jgi:DNA-binding LytR/AlgR family response regulator
LLEEQQTVSSIADKLKIRKAELDTELSTLQKALYIEAKTDVGMSFLETKFQITETGIASFHDYIATLEKVIEWQKIKLLNSKTSICIKVDGKEANIRMSDIIYIKSCGNYVKINTDGHIYIPQMTTRRAEQLLAGNNFVRIHKSYIVNTSRIIAITDGKVQVENASLPVGKTYKKIIEQFGKRYYLTCNCQQDGLEH